MCWWTVGQGFAFGKDAGGFIGTSNFAFIHTFTQSDLENEAEGRTLATWFFFWAFSGMVWYGMVSTSHLILSVS